jgi:hypothetical protein
MMQSTTTRTTRTRTSNRSYHHLLLLVVVFLSLVSFVSAATASDTNNEQGQQHQQPQQLLLRHQRRRSLLDPKPSLNSDKDGPQTGESIAQEDDTTTTTTTTTGRIDDDESSNEEEEEEDEDDDSTSFLPVIPNIDEQELNLCLQRKDLEEVYGRSAGVVCTCINLAPDQLRMTTTTTTSSVVADDNSNGDNTNTTTTTTTSAMEVTIVVQLTCTDNKSRYSPNSAQGEFTYCLPKSERCDPSDTRSDGSLTSQCCGDRVCDVQRRECIATPESILGIRSGNNNNNNTTTGNDGDDEEEEESALVSIKIGYDSNGNDRDERDTLLSERKQELLRGEGQP